MGAVLKNIIGHYVISEDQILDSHFAIRRLQRFYMIPVSDMAEGRRNDRIVGDRMDGI